VTGSKNQPWILSTARVLWQIQKYSSCIFITSSMLPSVQQTNWKTKIQPTFYWVKRSHFQQNVQFLFPFGATQHMMSFVQINRITELFCWNLLWKFITGKNNARYILVLSLLRFFIQFYAGIELHSWKCEGWIAAKCTLHSIAGLTVIFGLKICRLVDHFSD